MIWPGILQLTATMASRHCRSHPIQAPTGGLPSSERPRRGVAPGRSVEHTLFMIERALDPNMQRRAQLGLNKPHHAPKNALPIGPKGSPAPRNTEGRHYRIAGLNRLIAHPRDRGVPLAKEGLTSSAMRCGSRLPRRVHGERGGSEGRRAFLEAPAGVLVETRFAPCGSDPNPGAGRHAQGEVPELVSRPMWLCTRGRPRCSVNRGENSATIRMRKSRG